MVHDAHKKAKDAFDNFVLSGMNIWQWAFQEREHEEKPVDIKKLGEQFQKEGTKGHRCWRVQARSVEAQLVDCSLLMICS